MADLDNAFLHTLDDSAAAKLKEMQGRLPGVLAKVREESADAKGLPKLTIWGVDMEKAGDPCDIILLKYLRAEEMDVEKAAQRLVATLVFRAECHIDEMAGAELPEHFRGHDAVGNRDREDRPLIVSRFGGMDLDKVFGDVEAFVRYRAHLMETACRMLPFSKGGVEDLCQVHDYSGVPWSGVRSPEVKGGVTAVSKIFGDHYPELKGKTIFVNFPAVFSKAFKAFSLFIPERTLKKFIILGEADHPELFKHVGPEAIPEAIGGMLREGSLRGPCSVVEVPARRMEEVTLLKITAGQQVRWEVRVCYLECSYEVLFVPAQEGSEEVVIASNEANTPLQAKDGVVAGSWEAMDDGEVRCRFKNQGAWFKKRTCAFRAEC